MDSILQALSTLGDLALVVLGFNVLIFVHELGHFVAARWAGVRVLAFALGFGPAMVSYRKGLGFRRGSSEHEAGQLELAGRAQHVSPTEYRLNWLPFGGYVRMLGQDDVNPSAISSAPDSYQLCAIPKRMVIICAGVIMNLLLAAAVFVLVFSIGMKTEPAAIGDVQPGSPAANAIPLAAGGTPGLKSGDRVVSIDGRRPNHFNDLMLEAAMTRKGSSMEIAVEREGQPSPLVFRVTPETAASTGLMMIGVAPPRSATIPAARTRAEMARGTAILASAGLPGVTPGMSLTRANGATVSSGVDLDRAIASSNGEPVALQFTDGAKIVDVQLTPSPELQRAAITRPDGTLVALTHLLGLTPVMRVGPDIDGSNKTGESLGLRAGDVFVRLGAVEFPNLAQGTAEIRSHRGGTIATTVARRSDDGTWADIDIVLTVRRDGTVGFSASDTSETDSIIAAPPRSLAEGNTRVPAADLIDRPGLRITRVAGQDVRSLSDIRESLRAAAMAVKSADGMTVDVSVVPIVANGFASRDGAVERLWTLTGEDVAALQSLSWTSGIDSSLFELEQVLLRAESPIAALRLGLDETRRVMLNTYMTFARLFQGTVKVEHLKGPVGIAQLGTRIADRGMIWLLFFLGLISVNLAVVNFLPFPVLDGGQFVLLVLEQIRGKPVPIAAQNAATFAGLLVIGALFLVITFNDVVNLFGG